MQAAGVHWYLSLALCVLEAFLRKQKEAACKEQWTLPLPQSWQEEGLDPDLSGEGHHIYNCGIQGVGIMFLGPRQLSLTLIDRH